MAKVLRWRFEDLSPAAGEAAIYEFDTNPNAMTSPFGERNITVRNSTAIDGKPLFFEGAKAPAQWQFSGNCLTSVQYEKLRSWVYGRLARRINVYDHFGRKITCVLKSFDPEPRRDIHRYWHHTYTITGFVVSVGPATIGETWK